MAENYGILRVEKIKLSDGGGLRGRAMHDFRQFSNVTKMFDRKETALNEYVGCRNYEELITKARENWGKCTRTRSDAVGMLEVVVTTTSGALQKEEEGDFFRDVLTEVESWYGSDNVLGMAIHRDETTPHCHIFLTPIEEKICHKTRVSAESKGYFEYVTQLNAKKICGGRAALSSLQDKFHKNVFSKYGLKRGESVGNEKKKNVRSSLKAKEQALNQRESELNQLDEDMISNFRRHRQQIISGAIAVIDKPKKHESADHYYKRVTLPIAESWANHCNKLEKTVKEQVTSAVAEESQRQYEMTKQRLEVQRRLEMELAQLQRKYAELEEKYNSTHKKLMWWREKTPSELREIADSRQRKNTQDRGFER